MNPSSKTETAGPTPDPTTAEATEVTEVTEAGPTEDRAERPADVVADAAVEPSDKEAVAAGSPVAENTTVENATVANTAAGDAEAGDPGQQDENLGDLGDFEDHYDEHDDHDEDSSSGLGVAAAAIVSAALGIVALTGTWTSRVAAELQTVSGQVHLPQTATVNQQISEGYGDGWHVTAIVNGGVGLLALIVAVVVLVLPQRAHWASWVRPLAVAGVVLGAIGLLVGIGMYFDLFASIPTAPATPAVPGAPPAS